MTLSAGQFLRPPSFVTAYTFYRSYGRQTFKRYSSSLIGSQSLVVSIYLIQSTYAFFIFVNDLFVFLTGRDCPRTAEIWSC